MITCSTRGITSCGGRIWSDIAAEHVMVNRFGVKRCDGNSGLTTFD